MIINNKKRQIVLFGAIIMGLAISLLFINLFEVYWFMIAPFEVTVLIDIILGMFLLIAVGMLFSEDSRINGIVFVLAISVISYHFLNQNRVIPDALLFGALLGVVLISGVIIRNRFDILATSAKILMSISFIIIIGYLLFGFFIKSYSTSELTTAEAAMVTTQNAFFYGVGIIVTCVFFLLLMYSIVGVKNSNIFVFGSRKSGKTYFLLGLHDYISNHFGAFPSREVILSGDPEDEKNLRLANLYATIQDKKIVTRTFNYHMAMYELRGKKYGIIPVSLRLVDYAGEYFDRLNRREYLASIAYLSKVLEMPEEELKKKAGSFQFIEFIKEQHKDHLADMEFTRSIIISTLYHHLMKAGKVIFLIDGEKVSDFSKGAGQLSREFGEYIKTFMDIERNYLSRVFGGNKKYALVVTKTDLILRRSNELKKTLMLTDSDRLSDVEEQSKAAYILEDKIFSSLNETLVFCNLINMMNDISVHFLSVSVDPTLEPTDKTDENPAPRELAPWGFSQLFRFTM